MEKRLHGKKERKRVIRAHKTLSEMVRTEYIPAFIIVVLLLGSTLRQPMKADNGQAVLGGAATGALIGGLAGGGRGAGYGALAGGLFGGMMSAGSNSSSRSNDPYYQLEKEERKLRKLQDKYDRSSDRKRVSLERQLNTQMARVQDLSNRLGIRNNQPSSAQNYYARPS